MDEFEQYLVKKERLHLKTLTQSRAKAFTYYIQGITDNLVFMKQTQTDISITSALGPPSAVDWYSDFKSTGMIYAEYPDMDSAVYISDSSVNLNDNTLKILDFLMRNIQGEIGVLTEQMGFLQYSGTIDYRYPLQDLSYTDEMKSCDGQAIEEFNFGCTGAYKALYDDGSSFSVIIYFDYSRVNVILKGSEYDFTGFLLEDALKSIMKDVEGTIIFITENSGEFVIAVDD